MFPSRLKKSLSVYLPLVCGDVGQNAVGLYNLGNYDSVSPYCIFMDVPIL